MLGTVAKADIIDPAIADAAFALKQGEVSQPVKGRFGIALLQVGKIEPGEEKTFEQIASQVKTEIAEGRAKSEVTTLRDKIEDERAAGSTLAEAAKKLGLSVINIEAVDRSGRGPDRQRSFRTCRRRPTSLVQLFRATSASTPRRYSYRTAAISIST